MLMHDVTNSHAGRASLQLCQVLQYDLAIGWGPWKYPSPFCAGQLVPPMFPQPASFTTPTASANVRDVLAKNNLLFHPAPPRQQGRKRTTENRDCIPPASFGVSLAGRGMQGCVPSTALSTGAAVFADRPSMGSQLEP